MEGKLKAENCTFDILIFFWGLGIVHEWRKMENWDFWTNSSLPSLSVIFSPKLEPIFVKIDWNLDKFWLNCHKILIYVVGCPLRFKMASISVFQHSKKDWGLFTYDVKY